MIELKCKICGCKYKVNPYRKATSKTCSKSCSAKYTYSKNLANIDRSYLNGNKFRKGLKPSNPFKKGNNPWNKNIKGIHLSPKTEFKKGQKGINWKPIKSVAIRKVKGEKYRRFIKINEPNDWLEYAKYVWVKNNGNIPKGKLIHHKDRDPLNDVIENLSLETRSTHINIHRKYINSFKKCKRG